ncbi:MAG TPA: hypothetical protein VK446_15635 [Methylocystis sp.]|nr:hypothetical protein [Methylocystis sp.]
MESIATWFQDWSDACEYARECAPDLSFFVPREPYSAFAAIALACFLAWFVNERRLRRIRAAEQRVALKDLTSRAAPAQPTAPSPRDKSPKPLRETLAA